MSQSEYKYTRLGKAVSGDAPSDKQDKKWHLVWRGTNLLMVVFFCLAAAVQVNDPDPEIWIPEYAIAALLTLCIVFKPDVQSNSVWRVVCVLHLAINVLAAMYLTALVVEQLALRMTNPLEHEVGRELSGVIILIIWLCIIRFSSLGGSGVSARFILLACGLLGSAPIVLWGFCYIDYFHHRMSHCQYLCSASYKA